MKLWLKRIGLGLVALIVLCLAGGVAYEQIARVRATKDFPAPGKLVDIGGGRHIQLDCRGAGAPTVVFEAGLDALGALAWSAVHDPTAQTTRACAYSRAGVMWSDPSGRPFSPEHVAQDLHAALAAAGEKGPYVMVGHSLGGPYLLTFTALYPADVAGLVFVDASHPDQRARLAKAAGKPLDAGVGQARLGKAVSGLGLLRLVLPNGMAPDHLAPEAAKAGAAWFPKSVPALAAELDGLDATLAGASGHRDLGDRPMVVLTRGDKFPPGAANQMKVSPAQLAALDAEWLAMQTEEAAWSTASRHQVVPGASHYIQLDQPAVVVAAVREVVERVRAGKGP